MTAVGRTVHGLHLGWGRCAQRPAFQMCLARAVTVPERFKGGTCSFGAPVRRLGTLPRGFKRPICSCADIIARPARFAAGRHP